jgi:Uma2 family endonuclease
MSPVALTPLTTVEDLLTGPLPEAGELWDGAYLVRSPSGGWHGVVEMRIGVLLSAHVRARGLGVVLGSSAGYVVQRGPDRVLSPDVSYVARETRVPVRGFVEGPPDLAVEIRSPSDAWEAVVGKGGIWIAHRVPVVWCVDPLERRAVVLRAVEPPEVAEGTGTISARPVLDLSVSVGDLLEGVGA